jgi:pimeloyl-ACP methyl ester carboxylesterase
VTAVSYPSLSELAAEPLFSAEDVLTGVDASSTATDGPGRLRIDLDGKPDILRFYGGAPEGCRADPVIFLRGDVLRLTPDGLIVTDAYAGFGPHQQQLWAQEIAIAYGRPFLHLARPGICGSSGDHRDRRCAREVALIDLALDRLKEAFGWRRLTLAGHSGGGHLVGVLMARRSDIDCAVISSGNVAVRLRNQLAGWDRDITGHDDFVDPIDHVEQVARHPPRNIIVLTDRRDRAVRWEVQAAYVEALRAAGVTVEQRFLEALDDNHHQLWFAALVAAFGASPATV